MMDEYSLTQNENQRIFSHVNAMGYKAECKER
jgi:hypothetical protein